MELAEATVRSQEIVATLEEIQKANQMIAFHRQFKEPDENAIQNFMQLRASFVQQLADLLQEFNIEVKIPSAA
ncbi:hypothetical protein [Telluribacter sp.]|jgi:hypothetical protein|uniref:hypothetical protein n=1 Tax=Telluribacter sp. TaxID=1978767 RepID=UPI002E0F3AD5|nr:hypothetical protein [Telluribacter sp.]